VDPVSDNVQTITLAGGCFWCLEAVFQRIRGVVAVESGYSNGHTPDPQYEQVCSGNTGHAEVVRVQFDPREVSLEDLLAVFFAVHDPTTLNRQGQDVGTQYRSGIYTHSADQTEVVKRVMAEAQGAWPNPIVTELQPVSGYVKAEAYHQRYFENHPEAGYCAFVVAPKVERFQRAFRRLLSA
jgi:peptide-methionine (S)-S-oxide reductase